MTIVGFSVRNGEKMHFEKRKIALFAIVVLSVVFFVYSLILIWQALGDASEIVRVEGTIFFSPRSSLTPQLPRSKPPWSKRASQENTSATESGPARPSAPTMASSRSHQVGRLIIISPWVVSLQSWSRPAFTPTTGSVTTA